MSSERTVAGVTASLPVSGVCVLNSQSVLLLCSPLLLFILAVAVRPSSSPLGKLSYPDLDEAGWWLLASESHGTHPHGGDIRARIWRCEKQNKEHLTRSGGTIVNEGGKAQTKQYRTCGTRIQPTNEDEAG